jgi:hypothetical protein
LPPRKLGSTLEASGSEEARGQRGNAQQVDGGGQQGIAIEKKQRYQRFLRSKK